MDCVFGERLWHIVYALMANAVPQVELGTHPAQPWQRFAAEEAGAEIRRLIAQAIAFQGEGLTCVLADFVTLQVGEDGVSRQRNAFMELEPRSRERAGVRHQFLIGHA